MSFLYFSEKEYDNFQKVNDIVDNKLANHIFNSDPCDGISKEAFDFFMPKLSREFPSVPIIYGTSGEISNAIDYYKMWENASFGYLPILKKRDRSWFIPSRVYDALEYYEKIYKLMGIKPISKKERIEIYGFKIEHQ